MEPITPLLDTSTGRLAELVHLLSDTPLGEAVEAVNQSNDRAEDGDDPWRVVADALVQVRHRRDHVFQAQDLRMPA